MYTYNNEDRVKQLNDLGEALENLIPVTVRYAAEKKQQYENAKARVHFRLEHGFTQDDLSLLSREVPDLFDRHKDWESNFLEQSEDGSWREPAWFVELESVLQPALKAAGVLRQLGHY